MQVSQIGAKTKMDQIIVSNHGCNYSITSCFKGIKIEKINLFNVDKAVDHILIKSPLKDQEEVEEVEEVEEIRVLPRSVNSIIVC